MVIQRLHDHVTIHEIEPNSPALKNALKVGDEIVEVDGAKLAGMPFSSAVNDHIRGPLGSPVKLIVLRATASASRSWWSAISFP